jgi:cytochrome c biogenesis protein CcdA
VKNRKWKQLPLTLVFAAGIAVVLLPVMLGFGILSNTLQRWHTPLYYLGGVLLIVLGVLAFLGRSWHMPSFVRSPGLERGGDTGGMFLLGIFSGVASSCCAPVLAGVMTLSALSKSLVGSTVLGFAYVFGMSFPLFLIALFWDRFNLGEKRFLRAKPVNLEIAGKKIATNTINIAAAAAFWVMGVIVLILAANGNTTATPGFQRATGRWLTSFLLRTETWLKPIPEPILVAALFAVAALFVRVGLRDRGQLAVPRTDEERSCCDDSEEHATHEPSAV